MPHRILPQYVSVEEAAVWIWNDATDPEGGFLTYTLDGQNIPFPKGDVEYDTSIEIAEEEEDHLAINQVAAFIQRQPVFGNGTKPIIRVNYDFDSQVYTFWAIRVL